MRAIESVLSQSFEDWELVIVSDGCDKTVELAKPLFYEYMPKIKLIQIDKQSLWSGKVRNTGIFKSEGDLITYLDADDMLGTDHLKIIDSAFNGFDWVWYNDYSYDKGIQAFNEHGISLVLGKCGTSNITHLRVLNVWWNNSTYKHDWIMIQTLKARSKNYAKIQTPEYLICHCPHLLDYDGDEKILNPKNNETIIAQNSPS
jgi:glycosyltransferase involved in cell wall biosynthesis